MTRVIMEATLGCSAYFEQAKELYRVMHQEAPQETPEAISDISTDLQFAKCLITLKEQYQTNPLRYYSALRQTQLAHPEWAAVEFLKETPLSHLGIDKLQNLFNLAASVYKVMHSVSDAAEDQPHVLACSLYEMLGHLEVLEAKQKAASTTTSSIAQGACAAVAVGLFNIWLAPAVLIGGSSLGYAIRKVSSGEPLFQERQLTQELTYVSLNTFVSYAFEQKSSGIYGRYIRKFPSHTLGKIQIALPGETFSVEFNLFAKHKIRPACVKRLHAVMLRALNTRTLAPNNCLNIIDVLEKGAILSGNQVTAAAFLDVHLAACLEGLKQRCRSLSHLKDFYALVAPAIIDVPGYKNSCGLFAIALGAMRADRQKPVNSAKLPAQFSNWDQSWLMRTNNDADILDEVHSSLREMLQQALLANASFQQARLIDFISLCHNLVYNQSYAKEMEALALSNEEFMSFLESEVKLECYQLSQLERTEFEKMLNSDAAKISAHDISDASIESIDSFYQDTPSALDRIIKQKKLLSVLWASYPTQEQRVLVRNQANTWFEKKFEDQLAVTTKAKKNLVIKFFGFLASASFDLDGNTYTLPNHNDDIDSHTLLLKVGSMIRPIWPLLFANYAEYLQKEPQMLSADELKIVAQAWNIELFIHEWPPNDDQKNLPCSRLRVYLTNPSHKHWQVFEADSK